MNRPMPTPSRRSFLAASASAIALLASRSRLSAAPVPNASPTRVRFGFTTYTWGKDWDIPTLIANCRKAAVFGTELRTSAGYAHGVELNISADRRREVRKLFADSPVKLVGLATGERFDMADPAKLKSAIENAKAFVKLSADVGSSGIRVFPNDFHKEVPREKTIAQIASSLNDLGAFARDFNQEIRLEAHGSAGDLPSIRAIMDHVTEPLVRVKLNSDVRDTRGQGFEHNFNLVKDRLGHTLHLHDLQDPNFPFQLQTNLLVKMNWDGWAMLETSTKVPDRVVALIEQREMFEAMVAKALQA